MSEPTFEEAWPEEVTHLREAMGRPIDESVFGISERDTP